MTPEVPEDIYVDTVVYAASGPGVTDTDGGVPLSSPGGGQGGGQGTANGGSTNGDGTGGESNGGSGAPPVDTDAPPNAECDFSGRWLVTERRVAVGLGVQQASVQWLYLDLAQHGDDITVAKGLICGTTVKPIGALSASVNMEGCWPNLMADNPLDGHRARTSSTGGDCYLELDRYYAVFGATADHYRNPSTTMPTLEEQASGGNPGWEDCDQDGMPGATLYVGGIITGTRAESIRLWGEYEGTLPQVADNFMVPMDWGQDEAVLAVSSEALKATGAKDGNSSLHFAQFARLSDDQAAGTSDDAICQQIRALAPQLTPEADQ